MTHRAASRFPVLWTPCAGSAAAGPQRCVEKSSRPVALLGQNQIGEIDELMRLNDLE